MSKIARVNYEFWIIPERLKIGHLSQWENLVSKAFKSVGINLKIIKTIGRDKTLMPELAERTLGDVDSTNNQARESKLFQDAVQDTFKSMAYRKQVEQINKTLKFSSEKERVLNDLATMRYNELLEGMKK